MKIKVYNRKNNEEISGRNDYQLARLCYVPCSTAWTLYSEVIERLIEKYKDVPLTKHKLTAFEQEMLLRDPSYIENIPRYEVRGYDREVGSDRTNKAMWEEFFDRYKDCDPIVVTFINRHNVNVRVEVA